MISEDGWLIRKERDDSLLGPNRTGNLKGFCKYYGWGMAEPEFKVCLFFPRDVGKDIENWYKNIAAKSYILL